MDGVKVKICGITNAEDAVLACQCGADLIGFVFVAGTSRCVDRKIVKEIISGELVKFNVKVISVGLFKDETIEKAGEIVHYSGIDSVQFHGAESPGYCGDFKNFMMKKYGIGKIKIIKAFKVKTEILPSGVYLPEDYDTVDYFVFDTFHPSRDGGTGIGFDHEVLKANREKLKKPFFVAGGLNAKNVKEVVKNVRPFGVDVSSGIEKNVGMKDKKLLKEFILNAKNA